MSILCLCCLLLRFGGGDVVNCDGCGNEDRGVD